MFRPRIIPVLLLKKNILVKSESFKNFRYIGDAINAIRIFSTLVADELILLDIDATRNGNSISPSIIKMVGEEANMPFSVGGGITDIFHIKEAVSAGAEKVVIGTKAAANPLFVKQAAETYGSSTIAVCIDVKKTFWGKEKVWVRNASVNTGYCPVEYAKKMEEMGAGEIIVQSVANDGKMQGYNLDVIRRISAKVTIPVVALGGAGNFKHFTEAFHAGANALAAGSFFVFQGPSRGILINYPSHKDVNFK